jgi:hypothetical protein
MLLMNKLSLLPALFGLCALASCTGGYNVEGTSSVNRLDGKVITLRSLRNGGWVTVDSAEIIHGNFQMKGNADSVMMVSLFMDDTDIMPLVLENGTINVSIDNTQLKATGTPLNDALYDFITKRNELEFLLDELERKEARLVMEGQPYDEVHARIKHENDSLVNIKDTHVRQFIAANYDNVLGSGVFLMLCSTLPYPILLPELDSIVKEAPQSFRDSAPVKEWLNRAKENMKILEDEKLREDENRRLRDNISAMKH